MEFLGAVWDDEAKRLTVKLAGEGKTTLALAHSGAPAVITEGAADVAATEGRAFYAVEIDGVTQISFQY